MLPVLLVITARLEFAPTWHHGSHVTILNLSRLNVGPAALLVDRIAAPTTLKTGIRDEIVAKADGVPLFVEELTKAVLNSERDAHQARSTSAAGHDPLAIPATLHDVLMARLDRMPAAKTVAQTAAAIGRQFEHGLLCAAAPWPQMQLEEGLDQLVRAGLLLRRGRPPGATYRFKHALIRDEAYQSLLVRDRRLIHGRILRALERTRDTTTDGAPATQVEELSALAYHASLAELWPEAAQYHHRSGLAARGLWAIDEAIGQFRAALEAYEHMASHEPGAQHDRRDAMMSTKLALCKSFYFAGRFRESHELLNSSRDELAAIDDPRLRGRARYWLARLSSRVGQRGSVRRFAELAIADSLSCGDKATTADAYNVLCVRHFFAGLPDDSVAAGRRAISFLEGDGPSESLGFAHHYIGMAHLFAGRFRHAIDETTSVLQIARALDHPRLACYGRAIQGWALGMLGQHQEGLGHLKDANAIAPDEATKIFTVGYAGCIQLEAGALDASAASLREAHTACLAFPSPQFAALFGAVLADGLRRLGRPAEAEAVAEKSLEVGRAAEFPFAVGLAVRAMARLAEAQADRVAAIDLLRQATEILSSAGAAFELAETYVELASITARNQESPVAYAHKAEQLFRRLGFAARATSIPAGSAQT